MPKFNNRNSGLKRELCPKQTTNHWRSLTLMCYLRTYPTLSSNVPISDFEKGNDCWSIITGRILIIQLKKKEQYEDLTLCTLYFTLKKK